MTALQRKPHLDTLAITLLIACCAFWGFQQILIKFAVQEIPPLWQASIRMVGATATARSAVACSPACCSPASSASFTSGSCTPAPRA